MKNWTQRKIQISKKYSKEEREAIAFNIVSYIQDRTKDGKGKDGKKWTPPADKYSKEYKESLDFKNAKGSQKKVNLTLTGDMLGSIDLLKDSPGSLTIGIGKSDEDHDKAEGNIRGSYGKKTGSKAKARDFLGISQKEVNKILKDFPIKDEEERAKSLEAFKAASKFAASVFGKKKEKSDKFTLGTVSILNEK